jgi:hypothetical protein
VRVPVRLAPLVSRPAVASSAGTPAGS